MLPDKLYTVVDKDPCNLAELCLLLRMQQGVIQGVAQLLQNGEEHPEDWHQVWHTSMN